MVQELLNELKLGKKMYLFQLISLMLFSAFLLGADYVADAIGIGIVNVILLVWMFTNAISITIYVIVEYTKILYRERPTGDSLLRTLLFKTLNFIFWFSLNSIVFLTTSGMSIPALALVLTFWIILLGYKTGDKLSKKMLMFIGVIWFITFFVVLYFAYPLGIMLLASVISNQMVASIIVGIVFLLLAVIVFLRVARTTEAYLNEQKSKQAYKPYKKMSGQKIKKKYR